MNDSESKNVIVVIVEGNSDKDSFSTYLNNLANGQNIFFSVCKGDILGNYEFGSETFNDIVIDLIRESSQSENYTLDDVKLIIQITDTDGVFADNSCVEFDSTINPENGPVYSETSIKTCDVEKLLKSRDFKRERLNDCIKLNEIVFDLKTKIPYEIYYMSCNLECALYKIYNASDEEKIDLAEDFAIKYDKKHLDNFIEFMKSINKSNTLDFKESWNYIKTDSNSLKPCSNFIIFLLKLIHKI